MTRAFFYVSDSPDHPEIEVSLVQGQIRLRTKTWCGEALSEFAIKPGTAFELIEALKAALLLANK